MRSKPDSTAASGTGGADIGRSFGGRMSTELLIEGRGAETGREAADGDPSGGVW